MFKQYFGYLECVLDIHNFRVLLGDFHVPLIDWKIALSPAICHNYNELAGEPTFFAKRLLGLSQHNYFRLTPYFIISLIFLVLTMRYACWCFLILTTLLLSLKCSFLLENRIGRLTFLTENTLLGEYLLLYDTLLTYDWSSHCSGPLLTEPLTHSLFL
jgi:hypothetical protein